MFPLLIEAVLIFFFFPSVLPNNLKLAYPPVFSLVICYLPSRRSPFVSNIARLLLLKSLAHGSIIDRPMRGSTGSIREAVRVKAAIARVHIRIFPLYRARKVAQHWQWGVKGTRPRSQLACLRRGYRMADRIDNIFVQRAEKVSTSR